MGVGQSVYVLHKPAEDYAESEKGRVGAVLEKLSK